MRTVRATIAIAVAALSLTAGAQSASAALAENVEHETGAFATCMPNYEVGVQGAYGAWGTFINGCSMRLTCTGGSPCRVSGRSTIVTERWVGHRVTMNSRIWRYNSAGAVYGWWDKSCAGTNLCRVETETYINPGESAAVQCNGVRQNGDNRGRSRCQILLTRSCTGADVPVSQQSQAAAESAVLCVTNMERSRHGLAALVPQDQLKGAARGHASAAVANPWWSDTADSHVNPYTQSTSQGRIMAAGYCPGPKTWRIAENTYTAPSNPTPRAAVTWWMTHLGKDGTLASNGHRKNILSPDLTELGVGVVLGSAAVDRPAQSGTFVQDFGDCINY